MSAALVAAICGCGHAERLHEKDTAAEHDRGVCFQRSCGCSEYRPAGDGPKPTIIAAEPVEEPAAAAASTSVEADHAQAVPVFPCPVCGKTFTSPQGAGGHRAKVHPKPPEAAKQGPSVDRSSAPATEANHEGVLAPVGTATPREDPAASEGDAPLAAVGPDMQPLEEVASSPDEDGQDCDNCGDTVIGVSTRGWCDGCEEQAEAASSVVEKCQVASYGLVDVAPDDLLLGLVQALERIQSASPAALLEQAFEIRDYFAEASWSVVQSGPLP